MGRMRRLGLTGATWILALAALGPPARASEAELEGQGVVGPPRLEVKHVAFEAMLGATRFSGDLSATSGAVSSGLSLGVGLHDWGSSGVFGTLGGFGTLWRLEVLAIAGKAKDRTSFPFTADRRFTVLATSISPTICALTAAPVQACFGLGWEEFDVQQGSDNEQIYGTTLWSLSLGRLLADDFHYGVKLGYRSVLQSVSGKKSSFAAVSALLSFGWQFRT